MRRTSSCRDIRSGQRRLDARVLGSLPLHALGSLGPLPLLQYPRWFESTFWTRVAVGDAVSSGCQPGVRVVPSWSVFGSPPLRTVRHCTGQVATDPQSPKGGSQRACPLGVPTPRLLGVAQRWRCLSSRTLLLAVKASVAARHDTYTVICTCVACGAVALCRHVNE